MDKEKENLFEKIFSENESENMLEILPSDEWTHKHSLISNQELESENLNKILTKDLALGFIKDDFKLMILNERWQLCVLPTFQAWQRTKDEGMRMLFQFFLGGLIADFKITRSKEGFERKLQAEVFPETKKQEGFGFFKPKEEKKPKVEMGEME